MTPPTALPNTPRAIAYCRVSTDEQAASGLGLEAQTAALTSEGERRGWQVEVIVDEGYSGKNLKRPGISEALAMLAAGEADVLMVAKLDRVSRSLLDFAGLLEQARGQGWALVALDLGVDTSTAAGELVANVMASVAQWERRVIGERTSAALQAKKRQGVRLGRPVGLAEGVRERIAEMRADGLSLAKIADALTDEGLPTARGGQRWYPSTVQGVLRSLELDQQAAR